MNIGILSQGPELYSTKRLVEAAKQRGHNVEVVNPTKCYMNITSHKPTVHYKENTLDYFHAIIPRIGASVTFYGTAVLRQFEMSKVFAANESVAITRSRDKLRSLQIMARKGIGLPVTGFADSTKMTDDLLKLVGGTPCIIKILEGTQGRGVVLAEHKKAVESVIDLLRGIRCNFLVQEFIKESRGTDIRCFVIGEKVVASMKREAPEGEFRSNLHRGGKASAVKITPEERALAIQASRSMGLNISGVDIIRSNRGPLVLEVNSSPGLEGIESASGKDIAGLIIQFIEQAVEKKKTNKVRGQG